MTVVPRNIVILGLSITSSWGNGHATTYRGLVRALARRGHRVLFLERDVPWYAGNRDLPQPPYCRTELYCSLPDLKRRFEEEVRNADLVIVGSYVPDGVEAGEWVIATACNATAFYDIDTPVTLASLAAGTCEYLTPALLRRYGIYLSFTGGPTLRLIESHFGARMARPFYCSVDPEEYRPRNLPYRWDLGYLGTYSSDRQPALEQLMLEPARRWPRGRFAVVGPLYPDEIRWPENVEREIHLAPRQHADFYGSQRFTLNVTREAMKQAGYSPSVRLFEAGACASPVISDWWEGLDSLLAIGREILVSSSADDTLRFVRDVPDEQRRSVGHAARSRILAGHTPERRAAQLESYWKEWNDNVSPYPSRRDRRGGQVIDGLAAGLAPEPDGTRAGTRTGRAAETRASRRGLHEPAGAGG